ncbi:hypothetical protein DESUT3_26700 [Desulfuromonas versatilis]|uniref:YkgJ family cysteine cluster protein n=1 Tax=Desulfuromonas versatilis TaxID=2802975 RepID=A0ABM8HTF6_9BACT|nr:YkgJ family cysteine cluster protein [Desulfuromonas versatilis]BCR05601.1 hypothetical protein DESUT3_26700 [Desulfuromonas versatilis]
MKKIAAHSADPGLANYRQLVARVDELCARIVGEFSAQIACRRGCDACCRHLALFQVEAAALALALEELGGARADHIRARAAAASPEGPCPLLEDGACLLYAARPLICRTHGLPLLSTGEQGQKVDFCPENFRDMSSLPARAVVNLEVLNTALVSVNRLFAATLLGDESLAGKRLTIAEALQLKPE